MDLAAVQNVDEADSPNNSDEPPANESRSSNPHPHGQPIDKDMSLSNLNPPPDDATNPSNKSLISPDLRTDDDYGSGESDVDIHHNRSGTMNYEENPNNMDHEEYDRFDDNDDEEEMGLMLGGRGGHHRRGSSMAERRAELKKQKEDMERKLRSLSQNLDSGALSIDNIHCHSVIW